MDLVQDDEPILGVVQKERGLCQTIAVVLVLEVEIERVPCLAYLQSQGGLANLPRADQGNGGLAPQGAFYIFGNGAREHYPCNLSTLWTICKEMSTLAVDALPVGGCGLATRHGAPSQLNLTSTIPPVTAKWM